MFRRSNLLPVATVMLFCAYGYAQSTQNCTRLHEHHDICGDFCAPTCLNPLPLPIFCPYFLCEWNDGNDCKCDYGYLRDTNTTECVIIEECSTNYD